MVRLLLPQQGCNWHLDMVDGAISVWEKYIEANQQPDLELGLVFSKLCMFDCSVASPLCQFGRKHKIFSLSIESIKDAHVARRILSALYLTFDIFELRIVDCEVGDTDITMPLVLQKTTTTLERVEISNVFLTNSILADWVAVSGGTAETKKKHSLKILKLKPKLESSDRAVELLASVLANYPNLFELQLSFRTNCFRPVQTRMLAWSIAELTSLQTLCLVNMDMADAIAIDSLFGEDSALRKSLCCLILSDCRVSSKMVEALVQEPPFEKLYFVDLTSCKGIEDGDLELLKSCYTVVHADSLEADTSLPGRLEVETTSVEAEVIDLITPTSMPKDQEPATPFSTMIDLNISSYSERFTPYTDRLSIEMSILLSEDESVGPKEDSKEVAESNDDAQVDDTQVDDNAWDYAGES